MTSEQVEKAHALLESMKDAERKTNPGQCKMFSRGDDCSCVLCLCDEMLGLLKAHESSEGSKDAR
jgi:hypothetical protein